MRRLALEGKTGDRALARLLRHRLGPLVENLAAEESFVPRAWFGCLACSVHGRLMLVLAYKEPPWSGVLVPTDRSRHAKLPAAVDGLRVHPVLPNWLVLPMSSDTAPVGLARADDPRLGVEPRPKRRARRRA